MCKTTFILWLLQHTNMQTAILGSRKGGDLEWRRLIRFADAFSRVSVLIVTNISGVSQSRSVAEPLLMISHRLHRQVQLDG